MLTPGKVFRLLYIQRALIRNGLDELVFAMHLFRPVRFLFYALPWNWFRQIREPRAVRLRKVLEELGPIYVKLGQLLSTRRDMLPEDIATELSKLTDDVPPFPGKQARKIIENAFDKNLDEVFLEFNEEPLASASIAQVHEAKLKNGREVIVKVVRPGIETSIRHDIGFMHILAEMAENYSIDARGLKPTAIVAEFEKTILNELDLTREAASASQLRRNFSDSEKLYIPQIEWELSRRNVMVMERINGISMHDIEGLKRANIDLKWLAETGVELFFTQVFRDSFFHADVHPGNIFVKPDEDGKHPRIMMVDFGIMSSLSEFDQRYLAENFLAFLNKDYQRVAELHVESGWVPKETRVDEFEFAIRTVCEPLFDRPLKDISFGTLLLRLFQTAKRFNMVIMPQLVLLQKTLVSIEGLGRQLYPDLNLWHTARPLLERWMSERVGIRGLAKSTRENVPRWLDRLPELPTKIIDLADRLREGNLSVEWKTEEIKHLRMEMRENNRKSIYAIIGSSLLISCAIVTGTHAEEIMRWSDVPVLTWVLGGAAVFFFSIAFKD